MSELSPEAKRMLSQLRSVHDPSPAERSSGDAAVRRMLVAQGLPRFPPLAPAAVSGRAARSGIGSKLGWVAGATLLASVGLWGVNTPRAPKSTTAERQDSQLQPPQSAQAALPAREHDVQPDAAAPSEVVSQPPSHAVSPHKRHFKPAESLLADELRFIASVDADLRAHDYAGALRRIEQHKQPSVLHEELAAMRVLALCGARDGRAPHERAQFLKLSPSSVLNARVRAACPGGSNP
jgi:hypothetical protein